MQILLFDETIANATYTIVRGVYGTVAKVYDMMINLVDVTSKYDFSDFAQNIYVIAGIFMLFRVAIGLIGMIINPDQVNDKNTGAGKLLTRVVTSIVLLLVFAPTGFLLRSNGLLDRTQNAIIGDNGFINRLIIADMSEASPNSVRTNDKIYYKSNLFFDNVYAAKPKTCYFLHLVTGEETESTPFYKITFYENVYGDGMKLGKKSDVYMKFEQGSENVGDVKFEFTRYETYLYDKNNKENISFSDIQNCENIAFDTTPYDAKIYKTNSKTPKSMVVYGYNTLQDMNNALLTDIDKNTDTYEKIADNCVKPENKNHPTCQALTKYVGDWLTGVGIEAKIFSQNVLESFQECDGSEKCEKAKDTQFGIDKETATADTETTAADGKDAIVDLMADDKLELDFVLALIAAIGLIVFLVILCVDVVVRNLKLMLLEMIAPIPIISYVDPKDKIFMTWLKMFFSVYVDLFIKLIAVKLVLVLVKQVEKFDVTGLEYFFVIIGILIFAKLVPSMISKIFGLEIGSSFKDIGSMLKSGAGFAAGAAIGGVVGAATGKGVAGRIGGALGGTLRGAGSGSKGKVMGGAQAISSRNAKVNQQKAEGLNAFDRMMIGAAGMVGYSPKAKLDNKIKDQVDKKQMLDNFRKHKDNIEEKAESSNYLSDQKAKMALNPDNYQYGGKTGKDAFKQARSDFIALNEINRKSETTGNIEYYDSSQDRWIDSGQATNYVNSNGQLSSIKFESGANGKIKQAERLMRDEISVNTSLQKELGKTAADVQNFAAYENVEAIARNKSNEYESQITKVQKSDAYAKAQTFEDASKK